LFCPNWLFTASSVEIDLTSPTCTVSDDELPLPPTRMKLPDEKMDDVSEHH